MAQSDQIAALASALCEAQHELQSAKKDSINPHFRSKYADLGAIWDACRASLHKHGLAVIQAPEPSDVGILLRTVLMHKSGEWIDGTLLIPASKQDPQGYGSAMSYARRYALASMVGIVADEDDDGNAASQPQQRAASYSQPTQQVARPAAAQPATNGKALASEPQRKKLFAVWEEGGWPGTLQEWVLENYKCELPALAMKDASSAIELLEAEVKKALTPA